MPKTFSDYLEDFNTLYSQQKRIGSNFHNKVLGVASNASERSARNKDKGYSEEYIRTRFVYALIKSGKYPKENICIEFKIPKGNGGVDIKVDIVVFKDQSWENILKSGVSNARSQLRQKFLVMFETKKNNKTVDKAIENQLRPALAENESDDDIYGIYFDNESGVLIFKKTMNLPILRYNNAKNIIQFGSNNLNYSDRDDLFDIPSYDDLITRNNQMANIGDLKYEELDFIDDETFDNMFTYWKSKSNELSCNNADVLIIEFLTIKVIDELLSRENDKRKLKFYITENEKLPNSIQDFRKRINELYTETSQYNLLTPRQFNYDSNSQNLNPSIENDEKLLIEIINRLQKRSILKGKNNTFSQILYNNFMQQAVKEKYFTPAPVVETIINMINPKENESICDPCCGFGEFLTTAHNHIKKNGPTAKGKYFGFDKKIEYVNLAKLNMVINGENNPTLECMDSLKQKYYEDKTITRLGDFINTAWEKETWAHKQYPKENKINNYDVIVANPPFGRQSILNIHKDISAGEISLYETYCNKLDPKNGIPQFPTKIDSSVLYLENCYKLLKEKGRMGVVISNSIASIEEWKNIRKWLIEKMRIVALFDLPAGTFGDARVSTTVIIAYKPAAEDKSLVTNDYDIFVKEVENIGYEVKQKSRKIFFNPNYKINKTTFELTSEIDEDFTEMVREFKDYLKNQDDKIKTAFL